MNKHLNLVPYFGGKSPQLHWLLDKFPKGNFHFIDLMCGAANVALNVNYPLITINDINDDVINLFQTLRNNEEELIRAIYFTPFSRQELMNILNQKVPAATNVEKARQYFVKCLIGYGANGSQNNHKGIGFEYKINTSKFYKVDGWNSKLNKLHNIVERLRRMQIENIDALELFDKVNHPNSIIYIDPPYVLSTRKSKKRYKHEVTDDFHFKLAEKIRMAKCYVIVSGYDSPLYSELFRDMHLCIGKPNKSNTGNNLVTEFLWTNYDPEILNKRNLKLQF